MNVRAGTKAEYAAHIRASAPYVSKLNKQGRLVTFKAPDGRELVDFDATDRMVRDTADMGRSRNGENARPASAAPVGPQIEMPSGGGRVDAIFRQAQAQERAYNAKIAELEYRKRAGELVRLSEVEADNSKLLVNLRETFMQLPARVVPMLVASPDAASMDRVLREEIATALRLVAEAD